MSTREASALRRESRSRSKERITISKSADTASTANSDVTVGDFLGETFSRYVAEFAAADDELASGGNDPELVHRARVAVRKLRSALRTFRTLLEANWVKEQRDRLRGLSVELSAARDADILLTRVRANVHLLDAADALAADAIFAALIAARDRAYARLREARQSAEHRFLPEELAAIAQQPAILDPHVRITGVLQPVLEKVYRRLRKCVRRCSKHPTDEALHAARIAAKHLRYALEASARVAGRKMMRVAREVERLQDVLGEEHDATLAAGRLRELVQAPADAFVAGEIARIEREAAARARSHWHVAWKRVKEEAAVLART